MNNYQDGIYLLTREQIQSFQQGIKINLANAQSMIKPHNSAQEPLLNNHQNLPPIHYQNLSAGNEQYFGNQGSFVIQPGYQLQNPSQNPRQNPPEQQFPQNQFQNPPQNQQYPIQNPSLNQFQNQPQNSQQYPPLPPSQNVQNPPQIPPPNPPLDPLPSSHQPNGSNGQVVPIGYQNPVILVIKNFQQGYEQYHEIIPKLLGSYFSFTIACICLQLITCGAKSAASLWIVNFILLSIAMALVRFTYIYQKSYFLYIHLFFMIVQFALEVPAFGIAVSHPPILYVDTKIFGTDIVLTQEAGNCQMFSDQSEVPSEWLRYWNGLQFGNLIVCLIQFIQSFFVMYHVLKRSWNFLQFVRNQNPQ